MPNEEPMDDRIGTEAMGETQSQFPNRRGPIAGSYRESEYSPRGRFGPREAGSTLAFSAAIQPAIIYASYQLEQMAEVANPSLDTYGAIGVFSAAWGSQFAIALFLKIASGFVRNFGEGLLRDLGAWLWSHALHAAWGTFVDTCFGWLPWRRKKPAIWDRVTVPDEDSNPRPTPIRDWWERRKRGNQ